MKVIFRDKFPSWFFFQRADIPEISGYSPYGHRICIDFMIIKKALCFDIKKQCAIVILDSEFNQNYKRMGRYVAHNSTLLNKTTLEQFATKRTTAINQTICKRWLIDHHHSRGHRFALTSSNLTRCYDRIIHSAAAIVLLRVGIAHNKIKSMVVSIQRMIHNIRTAFGDSDII